MISKETLCPVDGIIVQGDPNIFISTANLDGEQALKIRYPVEK